MKKVMKKQLKEDEFVTTVTKVIDFAKKRKKELIAATTAILVIILVILGVRFIKAQQVRRESALLSQIFELSTEALENPEKLTELEELAGKGKFARVATIPVSYTHLTLPTN